MQHTLQQRPLHIHHWPAQTLPHILLPSCAGGLSDVLRLGLGQGQQQHLAFKDFESGGALDSALALIEHLVEGSGH